MRDQVPELPTLSGVTRLDATDGTRAAIHALVLDHVLRAGDRALWADANGHATTRPLASLAPHPRVLDRVRVARGFTPFQHHAIVRTLTECVDDETALLVAPAVDAPYRADETRRGEAERLLARTVATLAGATRRHDCSVLLTTTGADALAGIVERAVETTIECERTAMGPRFSGPDFETLVYPDGDGVQTTLSFWRRVLAAREPLYDAEPAAPATLGVTTGGTD